MCIRDSPAIVHAIEAHHGDVEPQTPLAFIIRAADAISAARPGARRENVENYIKRLEDLEAISSSFPGVERSYAIQAGREVRIMVKPEQVADDQLTIPVSYTHLDVYKRQGWGCRERCRCPARYSWA